ncbi:hypothetical protein [Oerskovia turbata]
MDAVGATLQRAAAQLTWVVPDDASACGSQAVQNAVQEFMMRVALDLRGAAEEIRASGDEAREASRTIETADHELARAAR